MYIPWDPLLVLHMPTSWQGVHNRSLPHMHVQRWYLARIWKGNPPDRRRMRYHCASLPATWNGITTFDWDLYRTADTIYDCGGYACEIDQSWSYHFKTFLIKTSYCVAIFLILKSLICKFLLPLNKCYENIEVMTSGTNTTMSVTSANTRLGIFYSTLHNDLRRNTVLHIV